MRFRIRYIPLALALIAVLMGVSLVLSGYRRGRKVFACPSCSSDRLRPSWPTKVDRYVFLRCGVTPIRCEACLKRFYVRK